jgi:hypothetical protein
MVEFLVVLVVLAAAVWLVTGPLRAQHVAAGADAGPSNEEADLEAAREAKYREIREAELDYRTGKLSEADWRVIDRGLRAEAIDILRRLDRLRGVSPPAS